MERKRSEAAVIRDNIAEDLCSLNRKKNSLCLLSESGRKKSWRENCQGKKIKGKLLFTILSER